MDNSIDKTVKLLHDKYGKMVLTKTEMAGELGVSISTMTNRISDNINIPNYIKPSGVANATVTFPIYDVAEYLTKTVKVL